MKRNALAEAKRSLEEMGFELTLTAKSCRDIADSGCDRRTLPQSLVLAQILLREQPTTVRGAFYRAVSAGVYPDTGNQNYRQAGNIILKLRRSGVIPYSWIADSTRLRLKPSSWSGLQDFGETVRNCYRKDFWSAQRHYIEVIVEKDAMAGVLRPVTDEFDIHLNVIRGNCSETFVWSMAEALREIEKPIFIYYLGDHDPNGLDIERDLKKRLAGFLDDVPQVAGLSEEEARESMGVANLSRKEFPSFRRLRDADKIEAFREKLREPTKPFTWQRLAVTGIDFRREDLIGFPVRQNSNAGWSRRRDEYIESYGDRCVEVDAISSNEIRDRLRRTIESHIDRAAWERLKLIEDAERDSIKEIFKGAAA